MDDWDVDADSDYISLRSRESCQDQSQPQISANSHCLSRNADDSFDFEQSDSDNFSDSDKSLELHLSDSDNLEIHTNDDPSTSRGQKRQAKPGRRYPAKRGRGRPLATSSGKRNQARSSAKGRLKGKASNTYNWAHLPWCKITRETTDRPYNPFVFSELGSGSRDTPPPGSSAASFFKLFFSPRFMEEFVTDTNRYASQELRKRGQKEFSRLRKWKDVTVDEMYLVLGLMLNMGIVKMPNLSDYWSQDRNKHMTFFSNLMSRDRFQIILHTMLHCCKVDEKNRFRGDLINPAIEKLCKSFRKHFYPSQELAADETMIGFKGRICFKQYNSKKPTKWGLLARSLADSKTGYMLNIKLYCGKNESVEESGQSVLTSTMLKLISPYFSLGHHVFTDSLYTSLDFAEELYKNGTYLTGTTKYRVGYPEILKNKEEQKVNQRWRAGKFLLTNWVDKRPVVSLSTYYRGDFSSDVEVGRYSGKVKKPLVIANYSKFMGGVDLSDQYCSYYAFSRRSMKWWKKVFFYLIEVSMTNAYILYSMVHEDQPKISSLKYREMVVKELTAEHWKERTPRSSMEALEQPELLLNRFHVQGKKEPPHRVDCRYCQAKCLRRKRTSYYCETCVGKPGLHPGECFSNFHLGV